MARTLIPLVRANLSMLFKFLKGVFLKLLLKLLMKNFYFTGGSLIFTYLELSTLFLLLLCFFVMYFLGGI